MSHVGSSVVLQVYHWPASPRGGKMKKETETETNRYGPFAIPAESTRLDATKVDDVFRPTFIVEHVNSDVLAVSGYVKYNGYLCWLAGAKKRKCWKTIGFLFTYHSIWRNPEHRNPNLYSGLLL